MFLIRGTSISAVEIVDGMYCEVWARNAVEYVTSFTTVYKTAAANLIFKTREEGWRRVLDTSLASTSSTLIGDGCGSGTEIAVSPLIYLVRIFE